jgi:hypothetical protein
MSQWQPPYDPRQQQPQQGYLPPWDPSQQQWQQQPPPYQPPPRKSRKGIAGIGCLGLVGLVLVIAALASHSSSSTTPPAPLQTLPTAATAAAVAASSAAAAQTVTYVVTGSAADVTYGPTGSESSGAVPMSVTKPLGTPLYYSIYAQLQGSGTVSCQILVDGKVISQSTASGGYTIASCEISKGFSGNWSDTNG